MLLLTNPAGQHLQKLNAQTPEATTLRLAPTEKGFQLGYDQQRDGDTVLEHDDQPVLLMDSNVAAQLDNRTIDVERTGEGEKLQIR